MTLNYFDEYGKGIIWDYAENINDIMLLLNKYNQTLNQNNCKLKEGYKLIKDISLNRMNLSQINQLSVP